MSRFSTFIFINIQSALGTAQFTLRCTIIMSKRGSMEDIGIITLSKCLQAWLKTSFSSSTHLSTTLASVLIGDENNERMKINVTHLRPRPPLLRCRHYLRLTYHAGTQKRITISLGGGCGSAHSGFSSFRKKESKSK